MSDEHAAERELEAFYSACYARLVGVVGAASGSLPDAEEAVQDAFVRLVSAWPKVSQYDDPEAWVRRVAFGYLSKRRRKARNFLSALARHGLPETVPEASCDRVDVHRALRSLPLGQRRVIVLHEIGLTVDAIADELNIPSGTVKSRLFRARAALADHLRIEERDHA